MGSNNKKKITTGLIGSWIFGVLFLMSGLSLLITKAYVSAFVVILGSILIIPYFGNLISNKFNFELSTGMKWLVVILVLIFFFIGSAARTDNITSGSDTQEKANTIAKEPVVEKKEEPKLQDKAVGDEIIAGDFKWKITSFEKKSEIGEYIFETFMGIKADGEFIIINVEVENIGKSAKMLSNSFVKLVDDQERVFSPNTMASIYIKPQGSGLTFETINPGIVKKGKIVYDVPKGLKVANIKISTSMFEESFYNVQLFS